MSIKFAVFVVNTLGYSCLISGECRLKHFKAILDSHVTKLRPNACCQFLKKVSKIKKS